MTLGGSILNISSMAGENRNVRMSSYGSSKAAVNHLTRNIAFDVGPKGIRVNAIAPGAIKTDALQTVLNPDIERMMLNATPVKNVSQFFEEEGAQFEHPLLDRSRAAGLTAKGKRDTYSRATRPD